MRALTIPVLLILLAACGGTPDDDPATTTEEAPGSDDNGALLGGCILVEPLGAVPDDLYTRTDLVASDNYRPFTKEITVYGLTLIGDAGISDPFMQRVADTVTESFPADNSLDLAAQHRILRNMYAHKAVIPFFAGQPDFGDDSENPFDAVRADNSVCDIIMEGVPGQVMEVVEHILHYISDVGLHFAFPAEWGISPDSELAQAMDRAVQAGYYDASSYDEIDEDGVRFRVAMQEFAYWVISTAWNLQADYGPVGEGEWTITDAADLQGKMPDLYAMVERTVGRTMVAPSLETLRSIGPTRAEEAQN
ncbi:MAG TPA: hypothetical protein QGG47_06205 [Acidobacteriota bacterium]|nr:hypothetical protein [Acidobacteriota bacterium]